VHRAVGTPGKEFTLVEHVAASGRQLSRIGSPGGVVHRLDKGTSGVLVLAKTDRAHASLVTAFFRRATSKTYLALVSGEPTPMNSVPTGRSPVVENNGSGVVEDATTMKVVDLKSRLRALGLAVGGTKAELIARINLATCQPDEPGGNPSCGVVSLTLDGRPALSHWRRLGVATLPNSKDMPGGTLALVEVKTVTGRKHQVRRHLANGLGTPILFDPLYSRSDPKKSKFQGKSKDKKVDEASSPVSAECLVACLKSADEAVSAPKRASDFFFLHAAYLSLRHPVQQGKCSPPWKGLLFSCIVVHVFNVSNLKRLSLSLAVKTAFSTSVHRLQGNFGKAPSGCSSARSAFAKALVLNSMNPNQHSAQVAHCENSGITSLWLLETPPFFVALNLIIKENWGGGGNARMFISVNSAGASRVR